jgi:hypothetical protein
MLERMSVVERTHDVVKRVVEESGKVVTEVLDERKEPTDVRVSNCVDVA